MIPGIFLQSESTITLPPFGKPEITAIVSVMALAFVALIFAWFLFQKVIKEPEGTEKMKEVAAAIQEGASAYLNRQLKTMLFFIVILAIGLFFLFYPIYTANFGPQKGLWLSIGVPIAFLMGVFASYIAGAVGMHLAVRANQRVAYAALSSFRKALKIAFDAGGVSGLLTIGLGLLGATIIFLIYKENAMQVLVGFGFGGSLAALFMRMGGGIYTKAADVGADLVGKVEEGIPEDDPRNAAVIADNVGDNVGDCAGMAADVFESYEVTLVAAIILGAIALLDPNFKKLFPSEAAASAFAMKLVILPLLIRAVGVIASIFGIYSVNPREDEKDPMKPINFGFGVSVVIALIGIALVTWWFIGDMVPSLPWWKFFLGSLFGVLLAYATLYLTDYYTHVDRPPVTETAYSSKTGVATLILTGLAHGFQSSVWALMLIVLALSGSLILFSGIPSLQMYAVALTGLGLLTTVGYVLAMDTYGPITDNANGIFEMSGVLKETGNEKAQWIVAKLDAVGNTTKALTKALAIATAVIAATALFSSYIGEAQLFETGIRINIPVVFIGLLIGGSVPFLFSSFAINAVGRAAFLVVEEVRRQFREIPGLREGKAKPEYGKVVDIATTAAQKELLGPGILGVFSPIITGFIFGAEALGAFLGGAILTGQLLAVFMANAGAIWDNAKKKIEEGFLGGKGTDYHKAGVVGDTVGDPLKDTAGPAINPLIKVINLISILVAPVVVMSTQHKLPIWVRILIVVIALVALIWAVYWANRGSLLETEEAKKAIEEFEKAKRREEEQYESSKSSTENS